MVHTKTVCILKFCCCESSNVQTPVCTNHPETLSSLHHSSDFCGCTSIVAMCIFRTLKSFSIDSNKRLKFFLPKRFLFFLLCYICVLVCDFRIFVNFLLRISYENLRGICYWFAMIIICDCFAMDLRRWKPSQTGS